MRLTKRDMERIVKRYDEAVAYEFVDGEPLPEPRTWRFATHGDRQMFIDYANRSLAWRGED